MSKVITIGLDIAKNVFHAHGADERGAMVFSRKLTRGKLSEFFAAQRRRLGEVYTRPEIARFMLEKAGWYPQSTLLDPACGTHGRVVNDSPAREYARHALSIDENRERFPRVGWGNSGDNA